jgi:hypothetical protein
MADLPEPILDFVGGCPDCGERRALLPPPLPGLTDDFDWAVRDYDSFRLFMMQELAYRFPERRRWTPADMEVVIVELLAAALDRASHALDVVQTERFLDTARRPQSSGPTRRCSSSCRRPRAASKKRSRRRSSATGASIRPPWRRRARTARV